MASMEILLLSTDPSYSTSVRRYIEQEHDASVLIESDMARAIEMINWTEFDAVICDHAPETDGLALVSSMRDNHFSTPFILVHDPNLGEAMTAKALSAGADHALRKITGAVEHRAMLVMLETAWTNRDRLQRTMEVVEAQQRILDKGPALILSLDGQLRVRYINSTALDFFNLESGAIKGRSVIGRIFPPVGPDGKDMLVKLSGWLDRSSVEHVLPVIRQGKTAKLDVMATSWTKDNEKGLVLFMTPPTAPCHIGEGHCILEKTKEGIISVDNEMRVTFINAVAEKVIGGSRREMVGQLFQDLPGYSLIQGSQVEGGLREAIVQRNIVRMEVHIERPPQFEDWFEVRFLPYSDGVNILFHSVADRKKMEERVQASEVLYRSIIEAAFEGIIMVDENWTIEYVNDHIAEIFHNDPKSMPGRKLLEFIPEADHVTFKAAFDRKRLGQSESINYILNRSDGRRKHLMINVSPRIYPDGRFHGAVAMVSDITTQEEEQARMRFQAKALRQIYAGLAVVDSLGKVIYWNPRAEEMFGWSAEEAIGKDVTELLAPSTDPVYKGPIREAVMEKGGFEMELPQRRRDGTSFLSFMQMAKVEDEKGKLIGTVALVTDITARKKLEESLKQANKKLQIMAEVTRHDIVNQMTLLDGNLTLAERAVTLDESRVLITKAMTNIANIGELMAFSKEYLQLGTLKPSWNRAENMFRSSIRNLDAKGIKVNCGVRDLELFVDPMMEKVFYNLVDNSIRHGGNVTEISLSYHDDGLGISLVYEDDGIGIPSDRKEQILDERSARHGMRLVREIVQANDMRIKETGSYQKGARFEIFVPPQRSRRIESSF